MPMMVITRETMMFGITDIGAYTLTVVILIVLPGPNSMFCMAVAGQYGAKVARRAILGTFLGNGILITASALGAGAILTNYPILFDGIKLAGGLYLAYLGSKLLLGAWQSWQGKQTATPIHVSSPKVFQKALTVALLNPKGLLFFPSMMVQFVQPHQGSPLISLAILGLIFQTVSLIYLNLIAPTASHITHWASHYRKVGAAGKGGVGMMFIAFATKLWLTAV